MKKILLFLSIFVIVACGDGGSKETAQDGEPQSKLLSGKLKNTSWVMPGYPAGNISIFDGTATASMSETSVISNGTIVMLEEDVANDFVVFNIYTENDNRVFGVSLVDPDTIKISPISSSNSLEGYKEFHEILGVEMKKQ